MEEKILKAKFGSKDRPLKIGNVLIPCYVLEDGTRVLTQYGFYEAIGRSGKPARGRGSSLENIAPFLALDNLKPFIDNDLIDSTKPIKFIPDKGGPAWGYRAEILPKVCEVYLKARDAKVLLKSQEKFAAACDLMVRGLAHVGIIALVDEVTGYQAVRSRQALEEILEKFISKELRKWAKTFPDEFYEQMFRLRDWKYQPFSVKRPQYIGTLTNDIVYERLAPGVLEELKRLTPRDEKGRTKQRFFQRLTEDVGHPRLREHLTAVIALMRASTKWEQFYRMLQRALPRYMEQQPLGLDEKDDE